MENVETHSNKTEISLFPRFPELDGRNGFKLYRQKNRFKRFLAHYENPEQFYCSTELNILFCYVSFGKWRVLTLYLYRMIIVCYSCVVDLIYWKFEIKNIFLVEDLRLRNIHTTQNRIILWFILVHSWLCSIILLWPRDLANRKSISQNWAIAFLLFV